MKFCHGRHGKARKNFFLFFRAFLHDFTAYLYIPMKRYLLLLFFVAAVGCGGNLPLPEVENAPMRPVFSSQGRDSTACAYWRCSTTKKLYMQKYVRRDGGQWQSDGAFPLENGGIGAISLEELLRIEGGGERINVNVGFGHCPYCPNTSVGQCSCGRLHCLESRGGGSITATCPWCDRRNTYTPGTVTTGGSGG